MTPINQVVGWANRSTTLSIPALEFCWWLRPTARGIPSHAVKSKNAVAGQILIELPNCSCTQWNNDLGMRMRLHSLWDDVFKAGYMPQFLTEMLTGVNPHSIGEFNLPSNSKCNKLALFDHETFQLTNQNQPPVHYSYDNGQTSNTQASLPACFDHHQQLSTAPTVVLLLCKRELQWWKLNNWYPAPTVL